MDLEPTVSPQEMIDLFGAALKQPGWIDDKVADQFPSADSRNTPGMPLSNMCNGEGCGNQGKKRELSESLEIDLEQLAVKRPKES